MKATIIDMAYNLIDAGFIKNTSKYEDAKAGQGDSEAKKCRVTKS